MRRTIARLFALFSIGALLVGVGSLVAPQKAQAADPVLPTSIIKSVNVIDGGDLRLTISLNGQTHTAVVRNGKMGGTDYHYSLDKDANPICKGDAVVNIMTSDGQTGPSDNYAGFESSHGFFTTPLAEFIAWAQSQHKTVVASVDVNVTDALHSPNAPCLEVGGYKKRVSVNLQDLGNANIAYQYIDSNTIQGINDGSQTYKLQTSLGPDIFTKDGSTDTCTAFILTQDGGKSFYLFDIVKGSDSKFDAGPVYEALTHRTKNIGTGCVFKNSGSTYFTIASTQGSAVTYATLPSKTVLGNAWVNEKGAVSHTTISPDPLAHFELAGTSSPSGPTGSTNTPAPTKVTCNVGLFQNPLVWLICPIIDSAQAAVQSFYNAITNELDINVNTYFGNNVDGNALYTAWSSIRYIALSVIVVIALIMVVSQALSLEVFDAYTIKKVLPRLVFAVIFIALSWEISKFAVQFADDVGRGIRGLIEFPFSKIPNPTAVSDSDTTLLSGAGIAVALGASFGIIGTLSFIVIGLVAVVVAFATLVFRKMLIIMLVVLAPFAIACSVLPNTQKVWKMWSENFFKALMLFPLISLFIAGGDVFAKIAGSEGGQGASSSLLQQLIVFAAIFGPFFALPIAFRLAGGALAGASGISARGGSFLGTPATGLRNRRQKKQAEKWAMRGQQAKTGELFGERTVFGKTFGGGLATRANAVTRGAGMGFAAGYGTGAWGKQRADAAKQAIRENAAMDLMKSPGWTPLANNDDALLAGTYSGEDIARSELSKRFLKDDGSTDTARVDRAVNAFRASGYKYGDDVFQYAAARQLVSTGTGFKDMGDMVTTLSRAAQGNSGTASALAGFANSETKRVGRHDLAPSFGTLDTLVKDGMAGKLTQRAVDDATAKSIESSSIYELVNAKPAAIANAAAVHRKRLLTGSAPEKLAAATFFKELEGGMANAKGGSRDEIFKVIEDPTIKSSLNAYMGNSRDGYTPEGNLVNRQARKYTPLNQDQMNQE